MGEQKNKEISKIIGDKVRILRTQAGLTEEGLAFGVDMSLNYLRLIESGKGNITTKTALKISNFFGIEINDLYSSKPCNPKNLQSIPTIEKFYTENTDTPKFFIDRKKENSIAHFLKTVLLNSSFLNTDRRSAEVVEHCSSKYGKKFTSKEISRELSRMVEKGLLIREDPTGNGSVFYYRKP